MTIMDLLHRDAHYRAILCDRCERKAWAETPRGLRCSDHALAEVPAVSLPNGNPVPQPLTTH